VLLQTGRNISSFGEDESGELYVVNYGGSVLKIVSDGQEPVVNLQGVVNAASYLAGPIAPGEIISIFGLNLGPEEQAGAQLDASGRLTRSLVGTTVWFDDVAAPLYSVQAGQINAQVPYRVAGKSNSVIQVQYQGAWSNPVSLAVSATAPGLFAIAGGAGQGAILNANLSPNSLANPAPRSSFIVLYATGEGETRPPGEDGKLSEFPYPAPLLSPIVTIGGLQAESSFAGAAPGFAGLLQINVRVPGNVAPGSAVPVVLRTGGATSQPGLTLAVN
jgi:uncharacterized protein (TIGR03437 family)